MALAQFTAGTWLGPSSDSQREYVLYDRSDPAAVAKMLAAMGADFTSEWAGEKVSG